MKLAVCALLMTAAAAFAESEEQRLIRISKVLKPISDNQWNEIAGSKLSENYDIVKGDTLWDVSKRLFGNAYYWPKVWSFNAGISNPHILSPGQKLAFLPGSSESIPQLSAATPTPAESAEPAHTAVSTQNPESPRGSHEYDKVAPDKWAPIDLSKKLSKRYDEFGIDRELKIDLPRRFVFRVPAIANDTTVPYLGEIVGSRREGVALSQGETVFLKSASQDLQVGTTYSILAEPEFVRERKSDRPGYIYKTAGEVKVVGVKDELYIGIISVAYDLIRRGDRIYPLLPLVSDIKPVAAQTALEAVVVFSQINNTRNMSQFQYLHFDRGIEDGVQIGNVFRLYDYYDPTTRAKITDSDFLLNADVLIVHATAQFSTGIVIRSHGTFERGDFGVLLTNVSDLERTARDKSHGLGESDQRTPEDKELDELDELDRNSGEGLGKQEETEIKELDQWDKIKDFQNQPNAEPTVPSAADTPTDEAEKIPGKPAEPTLDEELDAPTTQPHGEQKKLPPAKLKKLEKLEDQTLDAPPMPEMQVLPGEPSPAPKAPETEELYNPGNDPNITPIQPTPPEDLELKH